MGSSRISRSCREKRNPTSQRPTTRRRTCREVGGGERRGREEGRGKEEGREYIPRSVTNRENRKGWKRGDGRRRGGRRLGGG